MTCFANAMLTTLDEVDRLTVECLNLDWTPLDASETAKLIFVSDRIRTRIMTDLTDEDSHRSFRLVEMLQIAARYLVYRRRQASSTTHQSLPVDDTDLSWELIT